MPILPSSPRSLRLSIALVAWCAAASAQAELVVVKEGTNEYHRPGCPVIRDGSGVLAMSRGQAEAREHKPHAACDPATRASTPTPAPSKPARTLVYIGDDGRLYHRQHCKRLKQDVKKIALDDVARKYWPCPACKPPIRKRPASR